jgi:hypothetical protein
MSVLYSGLSGANVLFCYTENHVLSLKLFCFYPSFLLSPRVWILGVTIYTKEPIMNGEWVGLLLGNCTVYKFLNIWATRGWRGHPYYMPSVEITVFCDGRRWHLQQCGALLDGSVALWMTVHSCHLHVSFRCRFHNVSLWASPRRKNLLHIARILAPRSIDIHSPCIDNVQDLWNAGNRSQRLE